MSCFKKKAVMLKTMFAQIAKLGKSSRRKPEKTNLGGDQRSPFVFIGLDVLLTDKPPSNLLFYHRLSLKTALHFDNRPSPFESDEIAVS